MLFKRKKENESEKAYSRIRKLINTLLDYNPAITEIKSAWFKNYFDFGNCTQLSILTKLGERYLEVRENSIEFIESYEYKREHSWYLTKKLYKVVIQPNKTINIIPTLTIDAPMNEKQIFDSILEIEQILDKYEFTTKSKEHKHNVKKFISRF